MPEPAHTLVRAQLLHTPRSPFLHGDALEAFSDGAVAIAGGRIADSGDYERVRARHSGARVLDARDAVLLPGLVDLHVHYPQLAVIGAMGLGLLEWLQTRALPEEARLADTTHAGEVARTFVRCLVANGTTAALVFGSHFPGAQNALFAAAERIGLHMASGLVVSDRNLLPALHRSPQDAYDAGLALLARWHGRGRLRYAVIPRFALSCSEAMLECCRALCERGDVLFSSHINESRAEIDAVRRLFPWASDYLHTYERFGLVGPRTVLAHDVHPGEGELVRLGAAHATVAHCPSSNAFLGSGIFPMARHLRHGVRFGLGTDVGAGTGLSVLGEGLATYQLQMLAPEPQALGPAHLLHLATRAGAAALGLADEIGDLSPGRSADLVLLRAPPGSTLEAVLRHSASAEESLGALFALAREESVAHVWIAGERVAGRGDGTDAALWTR